MPGVAVGSVPYLSHLKKKKLKPEEAVPLSIQANIPVVATQGPRWADWRDSHTGDVPVVSADAHKSVFRVG